MSGFKAHLTGSIVTASATSTAFMMFDPNGLSTIQFFAIFVLGSIGGLLPDIDSNTGKPLTILSGMLSVLIPVFFIEKAASYHKLTPEFLVCYFVVSYIFINYFVCEIIKHTIQHNLQILQYTEELCTVFLLLFYADRQVF